MDRDSSGERGHIGPRPAIAATVLLGIALFIAGFALTMHSLSGTATAGVNSDDVSYSDQNSSSDTSNHTLLMMGLLLSMVGVIIATVVPAVAFIRRANRVD